MPFSISAARTNLLFRTLSALHPGGGWSLFYLLWLMTNLVKNNCLWFIKACLGYASLQRNYLQISLVVYGRGVYTSTITHTHTLTSVPGRGSWQCCPSTSGSLCCWRESLSPSHPSEYQSSHLKNTHPRFYTVAMAVSDTFLTKQHSTEIRLKEVVEHDFWLHTVLLTLHCLCSAPSPACYWGQQLPHEKTEKLVIAILDMFLAQGFSSYKHFERPGRPR